MLENQQSTTSTTTNTLPQPIKIIAGADSFGCTIKDTLLTHILQTLPHVQIQDLGTSSYYTIASQVAKHVSDSPTNTIGLLSCGTGVGVSIFANKFPNIYAATCLTPDDAINSRSINNANVLSLSGLSTSPDTAISILNAFLNTPFKSPCPASGFNPWSQEIESFLDNSLQEMSKIGASVDVDVDVSTPCYVCSIGKAREVGEEGFVDLNEMRGGKMRILREKPTSAIVRFKAGSVEPSHYHTFGHDVVVLKGRKCVWNLSKGEKYELGVGDYLFTAAGELHRVKYFEDTEFFIKWDGGWDLFFDEDVDAANAAIDSEINK